MTHEDSYLAHYGDFYAAGAETGPGAKTPGGFAGSNDGAAGSNDGATSTIDGAAGSNDGATSTIDGAAGANDGPASTPSDTTYATDQPLGLILGNCQAESLRIALGDARVRFLRMPPVHELLADDLPVLVRALERSSYFVSQPIRDDYRGLPVGTAQLRAHLPRHARVTLVPVIRFAGLYPFQAIIRPTTDTALVPPLVPYHDLRTLALAAGSTVPPHEPSAAQIRAIADESLRQLRTREKAHATVPVADLFETPDFGQMRTINHPGNPIWEQLALRVRDDLGLDGPTATLGRPLLNSIHAPREQSVIDAWGLDAAAHDSWTVDGHDLDPADVRAAHLAWYREHPDAVAAGLTRHALALDTLGLR